MTVGARRVFAGAAVVCAASLVTAAGLRAQTAPERVPMVEETFKTVQLLRGIPVDTFFEVMGTFASSMGNDCTFCHASNAALDKSAFATQTPRIQRARQMITMMKAINQQYFGGAPRVTCFTCHGGSNAPKADPSFMSQYGEPVLDPDARDFLTDASINVTWLQTVVIFPSVDALDEFKLQTSTYSAEFGRSLGGVVNLQIKSGTNAFHGSAFEFHRDDAFDANNFFNNRAGRPKPDFKQNQFGGTLGGPVFKQKTFFFGSYQGHRESQGQTFLSTVPSLAMRRGDFSELTRVIFDPASGLLMRLLRFTVTPVAFVPTQLDYADYRELPGLGMKIPFSRTLTQTYMQMTLKFTDVQANVPIDAARFAKPAPAKLQSEK